MTKPQDWDVTTHGPLTLEAVKALHQPAYKYRIQQFSRSPHTPFPNISVASTLYVVSGACLVTIESMDAPYALSAGQFLSIPQGTYVMEYREHAVVIHALNLPSEVWHSQKANQGIQDGDPAI
jgi:mannose-6-phosphate isomerase-like protein (cupin superfamily)